MAPRHRPGLDRPAFDGYLPIVGATGRQRKAQLGSRQPRAVRLARGLDRPFVHESPDEQGRRPWASAVPGAMKHGSVIK